MRKGKNTHKKISWKSEDSRMTPLEHWNFKNLSTYSSILNECILQNLNILKERCFQVYKQRNQPKKKKKTSRHLLPGGIHTRNNNEKFSEKCYQIEIRDCKKEWSILEMIYGQIEINIDSLKQQFYEIYKVCKSNI